MISREIANPLKVEGITLLPGTMVVIGVFEMHHNATVWGDDHNGKSSRSRVRLGLRLFNTPFYTILAV